MTPKPTPHSRIGSASSKPFDVVAIADLHVGSRVGLADPDVSGTKDAQAGVRAAIFERYREAATGPHHAPDLLIVNGDAIEGKNRKQGGVGLWTTELLEQADHAADLIQLWDARQTVIVRGSGYHVTAGDTGLQIEEYIARRIGAVEYPGQENIPADRRDHSGYHWYLHCAGVTFHVAHKIGVSKVFHYQSTPTARQMLQAKLNDMLRSQAAEYKVRVILRAHAHYYNTVGYSGSDGFVMPCWKALDEWMQANGALDISPDLGYLTFKIQNGHVSYDKHLFQLTDVQAAPLAVFGRLPA